jgi:NAD-dependent deacetylase
MTLIDPRIIQALRAATRVVILTGAGVSAESGIPTFRDKQTGLWEKFDAAELATPYAFERDPALVWGWYEWRRAAVLNAQPNPAHRAIAAMANHVPQLTLITQNVDDLHERAGSRDVLHLHGELSRPYCESCRQPYAHPPEIPQLSPDGAPLRQGEQHRGERPDRSPGRSASEAGPRSDAVATDEVRKANQSHASGSPWPGECTSTNSPAGRRILPPRCRTCGAKIRPGVVWFGERLPDDAWNSARDAAKHCDVFLVCGTSSVVQPAASLTNMAIDAGATTIQVNPNPTDADGSVTFTLRGPAGTVLPRLVADTWNAQS